MPGLGYDLNTVEFACEDGIPYAIDFMNPAPDADVNSVGEDNFDWIVDTVAELAVRKAKEHTGKVSEYRWSTFLGGPSRPQQTEHRRKGSQERDQGVMQMKPAQPQHRNRRGIPDHRSGDARSPLAHSDRRSSPRPS